MFCFQCGASMPDTVRVCPQCGATITTAAPAPSAPVPAAVPAPAQGTPWLNIPRAQPYTGPQQTDGKAVGSLILGILALFPFGLLTGIPAVILGHLSRKSIRESLGRLKGDGMALAGLIMGYLSVAAIPIILIIAAIAIPSLLRARMAANESAAKSSIHVVNSAQAAYSTSYPDAGYARDLATLGPGPSGACVGQGAQDHACLIDAALGCSGSSCIKFGYQFSMAATCEENKPCANYVIAAIPLRPGNSGTRSFCSVSDAVIREQAASSFSVPPSAEECASWTAVAY